MKFLKGLRRDDRLHGSWRYANNIIFRGKTPYSQAGFSTYTYDYKVIGVISTYRSNILFLTDDIYSIIIEKINNVDNIIIKSRYLGFSTKNKIQGVYKLNSKKELIICWWDGVSNTSQSPKILNMDNPIVNINETTKELVKPTTDKYKLELYLKASTPNIELKEIVDGGDLKTGVYYVGISYSLEDLSETDVLTISNPISITSNSKVNEYINTDGIDANEYSNKSFTLTISNVDSRYKYFNIYIISKIDSEYQYYFYDRYLLSNQSNIVSISNLSNKEVVTNDAILVPTLSLDKINTGCQLEQAMYFLNCQEPEDIKYQRYANAIKIDCVRDESCNVSLNTVEGSYKDAKTIFFKRGFKSDEVYAFYIFFNLKNGKKSKLYHIPGRAAKSIHGLNNFFENSRLRDINPVTYAEDILIDKNIKFFHTKETSTYDIVNNCYTMGYWENENEVYPNVDDFIGVVGSSGKTFDLRGKPVRHHKFPSLATIEYLYDAYHTTEDVAKFVNYVDTSGSPTTTQTLQIELDKDNFDHKSINQIDFGKFYLKEDNSYGCYHDKFWTYEALCDQTIELTLDIDVRNGTSSVLIYQYRIQYPDETFFEKWESIPSEDDLIFSESKILSLTKGQIVTFYQHFPDSLDVRCDQGDISIKVTAASEASLMTRALGIKVSNVYIPEELEDKVESWGICYAKRSINNSTRIGQSLSIPDNWFQNVDGNGNIDTEFRNHSFDLNSTFSKIKSTYIKNNLTLVCTRDTTNPNYTIYNFVPNSSSIMTAYDDTIATDRIRCTKNIQFLPNNVYVPLDNFLREQCIKGEVINKTNILTKDTFFLTDLCIHNPNMYDKFYEQEVVFTGKIIPITSRSIDQGDVIFGGDTFIQPYGIRLTAQESGPTNHIGIFYFVCESVSNIGFRHFGEERGQRYYPKYQSGLYEKTTIEEAELYINNWWGYNHDYSSVNDLIPFVHCRPDDVNEYNFPTRIYKSPIQPDEANYENWRKIYANEYWDKIKSRGNGVALVTNGKDLFIQYENGLYIAKKKDTLISENNIAVNLGNAEILSEENIPQEIIPTDYGYIGCVDKFGILWTKYGIVIVDKLAGRVFLYNGNVEELTGYKYGLSQFFYNVGYVFSGSSTEINEILIEYHLFSKVAYSTSVPSGNLLYRDFENNIDSLKNEVILGFDNKINTLFISFIRRSYIIPESTSTHINGNIKLLFSDTVEGDYITFSVNGEVTTFTAKNTPTLDTEFQAGSRITTALSFKNIFEAYVSEDEYYTVNVYEDVVEIILVINDEDVTGFGDELDNSENISFLNINDIIGYQENSFTISFSLENMFWSSFHDWIGDLMITGRDKFYSVFNDPQNKNGHFAIQEYFMYPCLFYNQYPQKKVIIDFLFNENPDDKVITKILESISWVTRSHEWQTGEVLTLNTITNIGVYTDNRITMEERESIYYSNIALTLTDNSTNGNVKYDGGVFRFNDIYDALNDKNQYIITYDTIDILDVSTLNVSKINTDWHTQNKFIDSYFYVRLIVDHDILTDYLISFEDINIKYKPESKIQ